MKKKDLKRQIKEQKAEIKAYAEFLVASYEDLEESRTTARGRLERIIELEKMVDRNEASIADVAINLSHLRLALANDALELIEFLVEAERIVGHWARTHNDHDVYSTLVRLHRKWKENLKYLQT